MKPIIPEAVLEQHVAVLGKTGSGKSTAIRVLVEQMLLDREKPVCILDPKGDWWGMKSSADGKSAGYPLVIFGGEHADVAINEHSGPHVAELVATGNRPCIIDLGTWMVGERTRFFIAFASSLFRHTRGMRWLVIDEVHNFAPQGKILDPDAGKMLHWANRLASEGRGKGLQILAASQRPQKVHKDFLDSCETLIAMRAINPRTRAAIKDWIDGCADLTKGAEVLGSLAQMPRGTGWVWSPEIGFGPQRVAFPRFKTFDSFKPAPDGAHAKLTGWAEVDLEEVKSKLAAAVKDAEANDPKLLRAELAKLKAELAKKQPAAADPLAVAAARQEGREEGAREGYLTGLKALQPIAERVWSLSSGIKETVEGYQQDLQRLAKAQPPVQRRAAPAPRQSEPRPPARVNGASAVHLPPGELAVLTAAAQYQTGVGRDQISVLTGYKRSSRDAYIARLREKQYIELTGDTIIPTDAGIAALGSDFEPLPTGDALRDYWTAKLPEGERKTLEVLIEHHPKAIAREVIDERTGYKRSSRDAYLSRLRARRLVDFTGRGEVKASEDLFG